MSLFMDTGVLYPMHDTAAARHETAKRAFEAAVTGRHGQLYTSDYVYDEAVTLTLSRTGRPDLARTLGDRIVGGDSPKLFEALYIGEQTFETSRELFERYSDHELSFTDATTVALLEMDDIDSVLSFNDDFDGIVDRTDPAEIA